MKRLLDLAFDNRFHALGDQFYSELMPDGLTDPVMVAYSEDAAKLLELDPSEMRTGDALQLFSGNAVLPGFQPLAQDYAGHQFGQFNPSLGDGRALILGEAQGPDSTWDLCLKGAGKTPYSRHGDGRAVLRSSIREFLCSEAMAGLKIPTTRALCVTVGTDPVYREGIERASMLLRLSPSHVRFGSFENYYSQSNEAAIKKLVDHVVEQHFPELLNHPDCYSELFEKVVQQTAQLMAQWQAVGFVHGVMNTDNFSILGLTFDYGPFGFMDDYDPGFISNHSDRSGMYAYDQQPAVGLWNCNALARALSPLIPTDDLRIVLETYESVYMDCYHNLMRAKLGLTTIQVEDIGLINEFLQIMGEQKLDYTNSFRALAEGTNFLQKGDQSDAWTGKYQRRLETDSRPADLRMQRMKQVNPKYILRNYLAQNAIVKAEDGDYREVDRLLKILRHPFDQQPEFVEYAGSVPAWGKELMISCSS